MTPRKIAIILLGAVLAFSPITAESRCPKSNLVAVADDWSRSTQDDDDWNDDFADDDWGAVADDDWEPESAGNVSLKDILYALIFAAGTWGAVTIVNKVEEKKKPKKQLCEQEKATTCKETAAQVSDTNSDSDWGTATESMASGKDKDYGLGKFGAGVLTGIGAGILTNEVIKKKKGKTSTSKGSDLYKVNDGVKIHGPYTLDELLHHVRVGHVKAGMMVLKKGGTWKPARSYPEIRNNR